MKKYIVSIFCFALVLGATAQKVDRSKAPAAGPAPKIQIGAYQMFTLDNGLKVIVVENHKLPTVSYSLQLDLDPIKEGDKAGYTSMAGGLMTAGTETKTKDQISSAVDFIGATLSSSADGIYADCLTKHSETLLNIFNDVLLHPSFPENELEKERKKSLSGLASEQTDPNSISSRIGNMVKYGKNHPYGEQMTEATLKNITRDDLVTYYNTYFRPNVAYLVIVGDINMETAKTQANKYFGSWTKGDVPKLKVRAPKVPAANEVVFVPVPGAVQSVIDITYPIDLLPATKDALVASVLNNILGGSGFQTRLMQNLREDKAYTYGAYSEITPDDYIGYFSAGASVRNEVTDSSITQFMYEISRLTTELVDDKTLQTIKNIMTGQFARSLERPQTVARFAKNIERYSLPKDFYETYLERLNAVTAQDVMTLAARVLLPNNAYITVVGNKEIEKTLLPFDKDGKIMKFNTDGSVYVEMKPIPAGVTVETVMNKYVNAMGGTVKLSKIKTVVQKGFLDVGMAKLDMTTEIIANQALKVTMSMNGNPMMVQTWDGTNLKMSQMGQNIEADAAAIQQAKIQCDLMAETHLSQYGIISVLKGIEVMNGKDVYVVENTDSFGTISTDYFDVASGLKLKTISVQKQGEKTETSETTILEYKEVEGIKFPARIKTSAGGQNMEVVINEVTLNAKLKKKDLIK
jgi:predicted Zn-dependent peptidase